MNELGALGWWVLATVLLLLGGGWRLRRWRRSRRARATSRHGVRAEGRAAVLLEQRGYAIEQSQASLRWSIVVDGASIPIDLRADFVVRRRGRRFVADVKTGRAATQITYAPTRRQLLEYRVAYDVDGVLLIDMEASKIHRVDFGVN